MPAVPGGRVAAADRRPAPQPECATATGAALAGRALPLPLQTWQILRIYKCCDLNALSQRQEIQAHCGCEFSLCAPPACTLRACGGKSLAHTELQRAGAARCARSALMARSLRLSAQRVQLIHFLKSVHLM